MPLQKTYPDTHIQVLNSPSYIQTVHGNKFWLINISCIKIKVDIQFETPLKKQVY